MTSEQRKLLIGQLALSSQHAQFAATGQGNHPPAAGTPVPPLGAFGGLGNLGGMTALSAAASMLSGSSNGSAQNVTAWQSIYPAATAWSTPPSSSPAGQSAGQSLLPTMLPIVYPFGGGIQMIPQMQLQHFSQNPLQAQPVASYPTTPRPAVRPSLSQATQQLRDNILAKVRATGLPSSPTPFASGSTSPLIYGTPKRQWSASPSPTSSVKRPRGRPPKTSYTDVQHPPLVASSYRPPEPTLEEVKNQQEIQRRVHEALVADQRAAREPDLSPFKSVDDVINRLLPFHVYQFGEPQKPPTELEANLPTTENLIARARAVVDQINEWQSSEKQRPSKHLVRLAERLVMEDLASDGAS
ncbi:uncharacterized protein SPPG_02107 [Spizellomyces punctatus DAOM BR117]|uniref:GLTSCR protein conserved domain-containing protein n=1 Tax=Spizellomyces punctatus (strain DAOM BR117) TaxID=645134 RepID=A0A0L0HPQ6_SPIPD|nr:uncharacterized protein SPPG_02107 [Spizellomyces punctatus DAOM BR117]KND03038.1 hypothetical protein SPPG_02107 [Spizellomyces punctatus DAOM BR117]|eukprot:XP_016611077.1 hypothetical protein SPPG_02107 [Spizellomyces punctatus DAOM BR117]